MDTAVVSNDGFRFVIGLLLSFYFRWISGFHMTFSRFQLDFMDFIHNEICSEICNEICNEIHSEICNEIH